MDATSTAALVAVVTVIASGGVLRLIDWWLARNGRIGIARKNVFDEVASQQLRIVGLWARIDKLQADVVRLEEEVAVLKAKAETASKEGALALETATAVLRDKLLQALQEVQSLRLQLKEGGVK
jgi:hypothetical protein